MDNVLYWSVRCLIHLIRLLPLKGVFLCGQILGAFAWLILPRYRRLARENIMRALKNKKNFFENRRLIFAHFTTLGANILSAVKLAGMSEKAIHARVTMEGMDYLQQALSEGKGAIAAINHIGNWELYAQLITLIHPIPSGTVYQPLRNKALNRLIDEDRSRLGVKTFDRSKGFNGPLSLLREGGLLAVLVDQSAGKGGIWMPFFNRLCSTSPLAAFLSVRTEAPILPIAIYTTGCARWRVVIRPRIPVDPASANDVELLTYKVNLALEDQIRESPKDWFWVHNRWKTPHPDLCIQQSKRGVWLPSPSDTSALDKFRILVRSSNWLGDAVMGIPAVRALKQGRPDAFLAVLTKEKLADVWRAIPEVDKVISIPPTENIFQTAWKLRKRFDVAILLPNSLRSALEVWLAGIPRRIGFRGHRRSWLLNQIPNESRKRFQVPHQAHRYLSLMQWMGAAEPEGNVLAGWNPEKSHRIGICAGAEYGPSKRWLPERFAEVTQLVDRETPHTWVMVGVTKDIPIVENIMRLSPSTQFENLAGKTSLAELIEVLRQLDAIVTNDTGTMHLAAMIGVPTVAIFGPTDPNRTSPIGPRTKVLYHQVECSPCFHRVCPIDMRCMKAVSSQEVAEAVKEFCL